VTHRESRGDLKAVLQLLAMALLGIPLVTYAIAAELDRTGGPYVPTPKVVVDEMLRMAKVSGKDFVLDLGSGDGVIVLTAAREHKARGMGVDIDPELVKQSNAEAKRLGVADRVSFRVEDVFKTDVSQASVITMYLLPSMMINLRSKIFLDAKPGTRVVSHDYHFDDWKPDDQIVLDVPEKEKVNGLPKATINFWIVPAKVSGRWQLQLDSGEPFELNLRQNYQMLDGTANAHGKPLKITAAQMRGEAIQFTVNDGAARRVFRGAVAGEGMQGTVELGGGRTARWTAKKG
jgi:Methyltransferase domain